MALALSSGPRSPAKGKAKVRYADGSTYHVSVDDAAAAPASSSRHVATYVDAFCGALQSAAETADASDRGAASPLAPLLPSLLLALHAAPAKPSEQLPRPPWRPPSASRPDTHNL